MDHDYLRLLTELESGGGGDRNSTVGNNKLSQDEIRQRVHQVLSSPPFRGRWLAVVDDLPSPYPVPMEEAGLDWFYDAFPWANGKSVITTRASEWAQDTVCRVDGVNTQWDDGTSVGRGGTEEAGGPQGCSKDGGRPSGSAQVGSFEEGEACEWVTGKVPKWRATGTSVLDLVRFLHCFPLAVAQAAEYARVYHTETPEELQQKLRSTGLELRKGRRLTKKDEYPECFPAVVQLSLDKILQSEEPDSADAGHALRKLALVGTSAIPLDLLEPVERNAVYLLQEHSLVTVDEMRLAAMHALTQLVAIS